MKKTTSLLLVALHFICPVTHTEQPILPKIIIQKLEYKLITSKAQEKAVKNVRNLNVALSGSSLVAGTSAFIYLISSGASDKVIALAIGASVNTITFFVTTTILSCMALHYTQNKVNALEEAIQSLRN